MLTSSGGNWQHNFFLLSCHRRMFLWLIGHKRKISLFHFQDFWKFATRWRFQAFFIFINFLLECPLTSTVSSTSLQIMFSWPSSTMAQSTLSCPNMSHIVSWFLRYPENWYSLSTLSQYLLQMRLQAKTLLFQNRYT